MLINYISGEIYWEHKKCMVWWEVRYRDDPIGFFMGFRTGEIAGHCIQGSPVSSSHSLMLPPWWLLLCMKMKLGLCCSCWCFSDAMGLSLYHPQSVGQFCIDQTHRGAHTVVPPSPKDMPGDHSDWCTALSLMFPSLAIIIFCST